MTVPRTSALGDHRLPRLDRTRVAEAMHPGVMSCGPETPLIDVARTMATHRIHCLAVPVTTGLGGIERWAVVSDLDLVAAAAAGEIGQRTAGDVAATEALTVSDSETLERAAQMMAEHQAAHLVVLSTAGGHPVGILSTLDVADVLASR